jgi:cystathionine beta-lyase/cystathionine gamma-synthase
MTRRDTQLVQGTDVALGNAVPLTAPIYNTTTFVFPNARELVAYNEGRSRTYLYSRYENPTVVAVEGTLAVLDRAERGLLFSSGMAAVATLLMAHLRSGDEIICAAAVYGGTRRFLSDALAGFGVHVHYASLDELGRVDALVTDRTKVVWFETPVNPTLRCVDVGRLARACRSSGALSVIDNTFASPINQQPLSMGVDLVVQSVTKYLNGHSDVMGGVVTGSEHLLRPIEQMRRLFGTVLGPQAAAALGRGLKTLSIRVCRQNASAGQVAS